MAKPDLRGEEQMGIDLNRLVLYKHASLRFFEKNEHHITRVCPEHVLLLVFDGVLRFSEDGVQQEVRAGEYYIQKKNRYQEGVLASDAPKYLYVHFDAEWSDAPDSLSHRGHFDYSVLSDLIIQIDAASHQGYLYGERQYLFLKLLLSLRQDTKKSTVIQKISDFIEENLQTISSLSDVCVEFHYSKNYMIRIFKREFGLTPVQYINERRLRRAMYLLETTSKPTGVVSEECGYTDYPYFYKRFVQKTGIAPSEWRKQIQENPSRQF